MTSLVILVTGDLAAKVYTELGKSAEICVWMFLSELADLIALVLTELAWQDETPSNTLRVRERGVEQVEQLGGPGHGQEEEDGGEAEEAHCVVTSD